MKFYYNDIGTPQGGILSPLLANVYLNKFDNFIIREWEEKKVKERFQILIKVART